MMSRRYDFILVVRPPFPGSLFFQASDAAAVGQSVDRYSLMTYDYAAYASERDVREYISQATKEQDASHVEGKVSSNPILGIPNAPLPWVKSSLSAFAGATSLPTSPTQSEKKILAKTLVGLQFYGNKYGPLPTDHSTVLGHEFISAVRSSREQPSVRIGEHMAYLHLGSTLSSYMLARSNLIISVPIPIFVYTCLL